MLKKKIYDMSFFTATLLLAALSAPLLYLLKTPKSGMMVLLNGTSSAGKTTITKELQKITNYSWTTIVGDEFLKTYSVDHPELDLMPRNEAQLQILSDLFLYSKKLSLQGKNIIIDVVDFDDHYDHYCSILDCDKTMKVLVYCPLDVLVDRVKQRNQSGDASEERPLNLSFAQFKNMYKLQDSTNEIIVDQIKTSRMKYALLQAEQEVRTFMKEAGVDPEENIQLFVKPFEDQFKLNTLVEITLVPQHSWDLIINTSTKSPSENAQVIAQKIKGTL